MWKMRYRGVVLFILVQTASAHEHDGDGISEGEFVSPEPLDLILWWHICTMVLAFGILFPVGTVLGMVRSKWHVPLQIAASVVALMGWSLGHAHRGRQFAPNLHASFASYIMVFLLIQIGLGVYLKLHWDKGIQRSIRKYALLFHGVIGKTMPIISWVQMLFGGITALGFCHDDHLGQCLAHFIMGSSFIAYGIIMTMMLLVGQAWLRRTGKSQEFWDSLVIAIWGCINTFTEHRWGSAWSHGDYQHTSMGVVWWCAGLLGLWLSKGPDGAPRRNVIPGLVIFVTGYAMSSHAQHLPLSTMIHAVFGYTLMAAGLTRIIEICFILKDKPELDEPSSFQHLPPYLLFASGFIFMSATEEQLALISNAGIDHVSYLLVLYSLAFILYLFTQFLLSFFNDPSRGSGAQQPIVEQTGDAEEFELEGLISDDEPEAVDKL
ncbi:putative integral membrane protein [Geopyxis carbonaria]|nr:putative integral membrane protein [Geopyxis carbonaria]